MADLGFCEKGPTKWQAGDQNEQSPTEMPRAGWGFRRGGSDPLSTS